MTSFGVVEAGNLKDVAGGLLFESREIHNGHIDCGWRCQLAEAMLLVLGAPR